MEDTRTNAGPGRSEADCLFMAELDKFDPPRAGKGAGDGLDEAEYEPEGVLGCLHRLVAAFDEADGQSEEVYLATAGLLRHVYGGWAEVAFCRRMDGCGDRHFFRDGSLALVLRDLAAGNPASPATGTTGNGRA